LSFKSKTNVNEWVIVVTPTQHFSAISWQEQGNFQWYDEEVHFVLDQRAELDFYSASSLKQQSEDWHVVRRGHIILIPSLCSFSLMIHEIPILWSERTIYHTRGKHGNHYPTDAVTNIIFCNVCYIYLFCLRLLFSCRIHSTVKRDS
jgi:hypothetical protein